MKSTDYFQPVNAINSGAVTWILMSNRGTGKTMSVERLCLTDYIRKAEKFVWLRRTDTLLPKTVDGWLADSDKWNISKGHELCTDSKNIFCDGEACGYFGALNIREQFKGSGIRDIGTIVIDEFLPEDGKYLGGKLNPTKEPEAVMSILSSVARAYGKPGVEVRTILLANTVNWINPYFAYFGIDKVFNAEHPKYQDDIYYCEAFYNEKVVEEQKKTKTGRFIASTAYGNYAMGTGSLIGSNDNFIQKPRKGSVGEYHYNINYLDALYSVWCYPDEGYWYISTSMSDACRMTYAITTADHRPNYIQIQRLNTKFEALRNAYCRGAMRFENGKCKNFFEGVIMPR